MLNILFCIFHAFKYDSIVSTERSSWGVWILFGCFLLGCHNKVRLRVVTVCTLQFINCTRARASARNRRRWKAALNLHLKWSLTSSVIHLKTATRWVQNSGTTHVCTHAAVSIPRCGDAQRSGDTAGSTWLWHWTNVHTCQVQQQRWLVLATRSPARACVCCKSDRNEPGRTKSCFSMSLNSFTTAEYNTAASSHVVNETVKQKTCRVTWWGPGHLIQLFFFFLSRLLPV